jgi:hypothetical protein
MILSIFLLGISRVYSQEKYQNRTEQSPKQIVKKIHCQGLKGFSHGFSIILEPGWKCIDNANEAGVNSTFDKNKDERIFIVAEIGHASDSALNSTDYRKTMSLYPEKSKLLEFSGWNGVESIVGREKGVARAFTHVYFFFTRGNDLLTAQYECKDRVIDVLELMRLEKMIRSIEVDK